MLTTEQFDNYPFEEHSRYELDEGELIESPRPAYRHNRVLLNLLFALKSFLNQNPLGEVLLSENLYALSPATRRAPDAAVILGDRQRELAGAKVIPVVSDLCAEVLSPSETPRALHRKLKQYFDAGVKEVWLIDPDADEVEVWTGPSLPNRALTKGDLLTSSLLPGFTLALEDLFA